MPTCHDSSLFGVRACSVVAAGGHVGQMPQGCARGSRERKAVESSQGTHPALVDHVFDGVACSRGDENVADVLGTGTVETGVPDQGAQSAGLDRVGTLPGNGQQHGVLAVTQIVEIGFAGGSRFAEDPEQVIAELEGFTERNAVALHAASMP